MADIQSITQGSSYTGNSVLGGGVGIGVTIDPSPMTRLATFFYYRGQHLWEQKQKDDAAAAKQIADMTAYDITSPLTKYGNELKNKLDYLQKYVRENPDSLVYGRNPEKFLEREKKINEFETLRKSATASDTIYNLRKTKIDTEADQPTKEVEQMKLDADIEDLFSGGIDINKILPSSAPPKVDDFKIPKVAIQQVDEIFIGENNNIKTTVKSNDLNKLRADSELSAAGLYEPTLDENAEWFKKLSPKRQEIARREDALLAVKRKKIVDISKSFNDNLESLKSLNPNITLEEIAQSTSTPFTMAQNINSASAINAQIRERNQLILAGKVTDPSGKVVRTTFPEINLNDGLSEAEIIMMNAIQESGNSLFNVEKTVQPTGDALQRRGLDIQEYNAETNRMGENRLASEGGGGSSNSLLEGNALNDIEIDENAEVGEYVMGSTGNKQNIANIQRLLGTIKDKSGKDLPILPKNKIGSKEKDPEISYEIENIDGNRIVTKIKVNNVWYDREYFRNAQLNLDKEPKGGQKTSYKQSQQYKRGSKVNPQQQTTKETDAEYYNRTRQFRKK